MGKQMKLLLAANFNYFKYSIVKKATIVLFVMCSATFIFLIGIKAATFFLGTEFEAFAFSASFIISWVSFDYLFRELYKKIFSKTVKIFQGQDYLKIWIGKKEILIQKDQIKKVKAKAVSSRIRHGGRRENSKLIIYTTMGTFHFTNDQAIYAVDKVLKVVPSNKRK